MALVGQGFMLRRDRLGVNLGTGDWGAGEQGSRGAEGKNSPCPLVTQSPVPSPQSQKLCLGGQISIAISR
ncbi:MAG TPA: hypothetical protein VIQ31_11740 [Phormidium sp.]